MNRLFLGIAVAFIITIAGMVKADFLPGTDDIPLMEGIELTESGVFSFDTPAGQILTIKGETDKTAEEVRSFYGQTLTALGWIRAGADAYTRDGDVIRLNIRRSGSKTEVLFDMTLTGGTENQKSLDF